MALTRSTADLQADDDADEPMFPVPKVRTPLAGKSKNQADSVSGMPARLNTNDPVAGRTGSSSASTPRQALSASASTRLPATGEPDRLRPPLGQTASQNTLRAGAMQRNSTQSSSRMMPPLPSSSSSSGGASRKPLGTGPAASGPSSTARLASSTTNAAPLRPTRPRLAPSGSGRVMSSPAVTSRLGGGGAPSAAQVAAKRRAELEAAERALGAFGVVDGGDGDGVDALLTALEGDGLAARGFGDVALVPATDGDFRLELDI